MSVVFDHVATGQTIAGPDTDTLVSGWTHTSGTGAGVILVGFKYATTVPNRKSLANVVTAGGHALVPLRPPMGQEGLGWGAPKKGWVEVWGGIGAAAAGGAIAIHLNYDEIEGSPLSPGHSVFSDFVGTSLTYKGANRLPDVALKKGISGRVGSGRLISVGTPAFMGSLSVAFVGSTSPIADDVPHSNKRFLSGNSKLWVGDRQGPGTVRLQSSGGDWGVVVVNLQPAAA